MEQEEKDIALIEKYLRKELGADEHKKVEERLKSDASFQQQLKWHQDFMDVVREERNNEMKLFLKKVEEEKKELGLKNIFLDETKKIVQLKWIRWAAAVLVIGFVTWGVWSQFSFNPQNLYTEHFTTYPNDLVRVERSSEKTDPLQRAFVAYQDNDFDSAIRQFDQLLASSSSDNILFFKAVSHLSKGDTELAINIFEKLNAKETWQYLEAVRWYLALTYLKTGQTNKAKNLLEQIDNQEGGHFQQSSAKEILEKF